MTRTLCFAALAAAAAFAGSANAASITYTNGDTVQFTNGSASINGSTIVAPVSKIDDFFFNAIGNSVFSGTISTHLLRSDPNNLSSTILSNLNFTSVTLFDASGTSVFSRTGLIAAADETVSIPTMMLVTPGLYKLAIAYDVTAASASNSATYDGGLHLAAGAVPEAATWAMFVVAFGMVGASFRRRRQVSVTFA